MTNKKNAKQTPRKGAGEKKTKVEVKDLAATSTTEAEEVKGGLSGNVPTQLGNLSGNIPTQLGS